MDVVSRLEAILVLLKKQGFSEDQGTVISTIVGAIEEIKDLRSELDWYIVQYAGEDY